MALATYRADMTQQDYQLFTGTIEEAGIDLAQLIREDPATAALFIHSVLTMLATRSVNEEQTFVRHDKQGAKTLLDAAQDGVEAVRNATGRALGEYEEILQSRPLSVRIRTLPSGLKRARKVTQISFTVR